MRCNWLTQQGTEYSPGLLIAIRLHHQSICWGNQKAVSYSSSGTHCLDIFWIENSSTQERQEIFVKNWEPPPEIAYLTQLGQMTRWFFRHWPWAKSATLWHSLLINFSVWPIYYPHGGWFYTSFWWFLPPCLATLAIEFVLDSQAYLKKPDPRTPRSTTTGDSRGNLR